MELFAIGVVIILFMAVLKQFGILEPMSTLEGKGPSGPTADTTEQSPSTQGRYALK